MRVALNLATEPFVNLRGFWLAAGTLALGAIALSAVVGIDAVQTWRQRRDTRARLTELRERQENLLDRLEELETSLGEPAAQQILAEVGFLNGVIHRRSFSWTGFFFDLQETLPAQVRVDSASPILREDGTLEVTLQVRSSTVDAITQFLIGLEESERFHQVQLRSRDQRGARTDPLQAQLSAIYIEGEP